MGKLRIIGTATMVDGITVSNPAEKRNLYGLFVGINAYGGTYSLEGCIYDVEQIKGYLSSLPDFNTHFETLLNGDATKEAIIEKFETHLIANAANAEKDTVFFFHFSGHGCREKSDTSIWVNDYNGMLESIVCYGEMEEIQQCLISDKEFMHLIGRLYAANPDIHIVTTFDCCHAGGNTSDVGGGGGQTTAPDEPTIRQIGLIDEIRPWRYFTFSSIETENEAIKQAVINQGTAALLKGHHVNISACRPNETATEIEETEDTVTGLFTKNLIEVLKRSGNRVTYYDLKRRISTYTQMYGQTPQLYVRSTDTTNKGIFRFFLGKSTDVGDSNLLRGRIYQTDNNWTIDMGEVHGMIKESIVEVNAIITTRSSRNSDIVSTQESVSIRRTKEKYENIEIKQVKEFESILDFSPQLEANQEAVYVGYVSDLVRKPISIFIDQPDEHASLEPLFAPTKYLSITAERNSADYELLIQNSTYAILPKLQDLNSIAGNTEKERVKKINETPLVALAANKQKVKTYFEQIAHWEFVKQFSNASTEEFVQTPVTIKITDNIETELSQEDEIVTFLTTEVENELNIKVTNTHEQALHCVLLHMDNNFGVYNIVDRYGGITDTPDDFSEYQGIITLAKAKTISQKVNIHFDSDLPEEVHYFKVVVSTQSRQTAVESAEIFYVPSLPAYTPPVAAPERAGLPRASDKNKLKDINTVQGLPTNPHRTIVDTVKAWTTFTIKIVVRNSNWQPDGNQN